MRIPKNSSLGAMINSYIDKNEQIDKVSIYETIYNHLDENYYDDDIDQRKVKYKLYDWTVCDSPLGESPREFKKWIKETYNYPDFHMTLFSDLTIGEIVDNIYDYIETTKKQKQEVKDMINNNTKKVVKTGSIAYRLNKHLEFVFNKKWTDNDNLENNTLSFWLLGVSNKKSFMQDLKLFIRAEFETPYFDMFFTVDTTIDSIIKEIQREQSRMKEFEDLDISDISAAADKFDEVVKETKETKEDEEAIDFYNRKMNEYKLIDSINRAFLDWNGVGNYSFDLKGIEITTTGYNENEITGKDSIILVTIFSNNKEIVQYAVSNFLTDEPVKIISYEIIVEEHQILFDILHYIKVKILNRFKSDVQRSLEQLAVLEDKNYKLSSEIFIKELEIMTLRKEQIEIQGKVHKINKDVSELNAAMLDYHEKNFL